MTGFSIGNLDAIAWPRDHVPGDLVIDVVKEADRFLDDSSLPGPEGPVAVVIMGPVASGKTALRRQQFSTGWVLVDAAAVFLNLNRGAFVPFPGPLQEPMDLVGRLLAAVAVRDRRNLVTEVVGNDPEPTKELIEALRAVGYRVEIRMVNAALEECMRRNAARGDDDISAYYAQEFNMRWLVEACCQARQTEQPR